MLPDWNLLSHELQITLSHEALTRASETIAGQAETLADEMECGRLADQGGPAALRLLAAVVRISGQSPYLAAFTADDAVIGHA